jgi:hypothetical protein
MPEAPAGVPPATGPFRDTGVPSIALFANASAREFSARGIHL